MRVLFLHHFPLEQSEAGQLVQQWSRALMAAGHEIRCLVVDEQRRGSESFAIERVVCRAGDAAADLPFAIPQFSTLAREGRDLKFSALSDHQLSKYRDQLRRRIDGQIERFDPHVIHAQHIWVLGQLALETGVPYVLNASAHELADYAHDDRYRILADQAAENAGRILATSEAVLRRVVATFELAADRASLMPPELNPGSSTLSDGADTRAADRLAAIYQQVLDQRFGKAG
jgi:hypothetical protein